MKPLVTILTYCAHPALAYGTLLVFKTLRTGFPTADIEVFDNGSHPEVRDQIMAEAQRVGASFTGIKPQRWVDHYKWLLLERKPEGRPLVILDPDVIFWASVEDWSSPGALMAGRRMSRINAGPIVQHARLHPSLLWIQDVEQLRLAMGTQGESLISPCLGSFEGELHFWDTFSRLYEEMVHWCMSFTPEHLGCFDHLFFGSHLPVVAAQCSGDMDVIGRAHVMASTGNYEALKGIWREQDAYFARPASDEIGAEVLRRLTETRGSAANRRRLAAESLAGMQHMAYDPKELGAAMEVLARRVGQNTEEN
jgi:hypothetical protein